MQSQPGQLGLFDFDFGGRNPTKEAAETQVKTAGKQTQRLTSTNSAPTKSNKGSKATAGTSSKQKKRGRTDNKSPSETTNKPPSKKQNTGNMSGTKKDSAVEEDKASTNADLLALEKRLFAGFALLIDPLKKDIEELKNNQVGTIHDEHTNEQIKRKFKINEEKQENRGQT